MYLPLNPLLFLLHLLFWGDFRVGTPYVFGVFGRENENL